MSRWQVDIYVLVNCSLELPEEDEGEVSFDSLNDVKCDLGAHPENCTLDYFDPRDSWDTDNAIGIGYMTKLNYLYESESEEDILARVLKDFTSTQFQFESSDDNVDFHIDFISAWAFFDLNNPNEEDEFEIEGELDQVNGAFPNLLFRFDDPGNANFVGSDANWYFSDDFKPTY